MRGHDQRLIALPYAAVAAAAYPALVWVPVSVDWALYVLAAFGLAAVLLQEPDPASRSWPLPGLPLLLYLGMTAVSVALSPDISRSLALSSALLPAGLLYLLTSRYLRSRQQVRLVLFGLLFACAGVALLVLFRASTFSDVQAIVDAAGSPFLIVPNDILWTVTIAPLLVALAVARLGPFARAQSWIVLIALLLILAALVVLRSRTALIAVFIGSALMLWALRPTTVHWHWLLLPAAVLMAMLLLDAMLGFPLLGKFRNPCFSRSPPWTAAWQLFLERPWFGHGAHSFVALYQARLPSDPALFCEAVDSRLTPWPHNLYLELLSSQGVFGAGLFAIVTGWAVIAARRVARAADAGLRVLGVGLLAAWGVFLFGALLELSLLRLWVVTTFALLLGLTQQLCALARQGDDNPKSGK